MPQCTGLASSTKVALVTGANKGIGKEIVRLLASEEESEWLILLGSRDVDRGNQAVKELVSDMKKGNKKNKIVCCQLDLTDESSISSACDLVNQLGDGKLDVLVNNAAICFNDSTLYGMVPHTPFDQQAEITIRTNFFGTLAVTQQMLPYLQKSTSPRIITIASAAGRLAILKSNDLVRTFTSPDLQLNELESLLKEFVVDVESGTHAAKGWPNTCYGMSKLGLIALTKVILARDYPEIMCTVVDPGFCSTDQNSNAVGALPAKRGAITPVALATTTNEFVTGRYFFQEQEIAW